MVVRGLNVIKVSIEMMNKARAADEELWSEYISTIDPDYRQFMPFHRWLSLEVIKLREKLECQS